MIDHLLSIESVTSRTTAALQTELQRSKQLSCACAYKQEFSRSGHGCDSTTLHCLQKVVCVCLIGT